LNPGSRPVAAAKGGEMVMSEAVWKDVSSEVAAQPRSLELKGYAGPVRTYATQLTPK
jgi:adenylate cyclase